VLHDDGGAGTDRSRATWPLLSATGGRAATESYGGVEPRPGRGAASAGRNDCSFAAQRRRISDPFNLQRFVQAQEPVLDTVRAARRPEAKPLDVVHLPQLRGLGRSSMAEY